MLVLPYNKNGHKTHKSEDFTRSSVCCTGSIMSDTVLFKLFKLLRLPCKESVILIEVESRLCVCNIWKGFYYFVSEILSVTRVRRIVVGQLKGIVFSMDKSRGQCCVRSEL